MAALNPSPKSSQPENDASTPAAVHHRSGFHARPAGRPAAARSGATQ